MRQTLPFLILLYVCSCDQHKPKETSASQQIGSARESATKAGSPKRNDTIPIASSIDLVGWKKQQDSLRNEILKSKENSILKQSFLQELYVRNVVKLENDGVFFSLPFNLHGLDCLAPDCYQTDVTFNFKLGDTLGFPEELPFREHEHGCVDKVTIISGIFRLEELDTNHVIYHSTKHQRTLVLFRTNEKSGDYAFYFTKVKPGRINGKNVYSITENYNEDDENSLCPFRCTILAGEYENFMQNDLPER